MVASGASRDAVRLSGRHRGTALGNLRLKDGVHARG